VSFGFATIYWYYVYITEEENLHKNAEMFVKGVKDIEKDEEKY